MIKKQTTCMFMDKCSGCTAQTKCISATSVTTDLRKYLLKIQGHRQKATLAMLDGKKRHEDNLKGIETLAQMGWGRFQKKLYKGERIMLQEVSLCSPYYKMHGIIDKLEIQYTKGGRFNILVTDLKPFYSKKYLKQISVYGQILSEPDCLLAYEYITPRSHKLKRITKRLYPKKQDYKLTIDLELDQYFTGRKFRINWMTDNMMTDISMQLCLLNQSSANKRRELHKRGLYYLDQLPPCKDCRQLESYCSLYSICQKIVYNPEIKERQRYMGARELLVKTKPKVRA